MPARGPPTPSLSSGLVDPFHRPSGPTPVLPQMNYGQSPIQPPVAATQVQIPQPPARRDSYGPDPGAIPRGPPLPVAPYSTSTSMSMGMGLGMGMGGPPPPNHTNLTLTCAVVSLQSSSTPIPKYLPISVMDTQILYPTLIVILPLLRSRISRICSPPSETVSDQISTAPVIPNGSGPRSYPQAPIPPPIAPLPSAQQSPSFLPQTPQTHHRPSTSISSMAAPPGGASGAKTTQDLLMRVLGGSGALAATTRPGKDQGGYRCHREWTTSSI
jgi:hypothetical protein